MNDMKNMLIAYLSSVSTIFTAIETGTLITVFSAIVLPILFFTVGKAIDVMLQLHFKGRDENRRDK